MTLTLSPRQEELVGALRSDADTIIAEGPVRAGKSLAMAFAYLLWTAAHFRGYKFLIASKSLTHIREAVVPELQRCAHEVGLEVHLRLQEKKIRIGREGTWNDHILMDFQNAGSVGKITGMTLAGVWINEAGLCPKEFFNEVHARCSSVPGAKVWADCNPEGPQHYLLKDFIERAADAKCLRFTFRLAPVVDNPTLSEEAIARIHRAYPVGSVFHKRKVLGLWEAASGAVYDKTTALIEPHPTDPPAFWELVVDGGINTVTHASLFGHWTGRGWLCDEYRHDARELGQVADSQHATGIQAMVGQRPLSRIIIDRFAQALKAELALRYPGVPIVEAENYPMSVVPGIELVAAWMAHHTVGFDPLGARHTLAEMDGYIWDARAAEQGVTKPVKANDHAMDVLRYWAMTNDQSRGYAFRGAA